MILTLLRGLLLVGIACSPVLSQQGWPPQEAMQRLHVAEGLRLELFAAEPMVRQPVTMAVDDRERVWVIQYLQYPEPAGLKKVTGDRYDRIRYDRTPAPPPHGPRGADRVTILEDTDGDGHADKAIDFVDGLNLASGLALGHGGVWILQSPYLLFYPDQNADDQPDRDPDVRLVGFGIDDAHSVANSLQWGPDGWLYGVHGSTVNADVRGIRFQQGIWRYDPRTDQFELFSEGGGNTYGLDFDRYGNAIAGTNWGVPGLHQMQGAYHVKNFGKHGALHNPHAYGYFEHMPHHGESVGKLSVGGVLYQAQQWPARFHNKLITANPLNHALYAIDVSAHGSTFSTQFLERVMWSDDAWFQPVDLAIEADGSLLVADWYDGNINYQITYRNRENFDSRRGRIYRIAAAPTGSPRGDALEDSAVDVFDANIVKARRSLRQLSERRDIQLAPRYVEALLEADDERQALHALWAINHCQGLTTNEALVGECLRHRMAAVRTWTVRLLGDQPQLSDSLVRQIVRLARDEKDVRVRAQLACTAKRLPGGPCLELVTALSRCADDATDTYQPLLLWWAVESKATSDRDTILAWLKSSEAWLQPLVRDTIVPRLARRYAAEGSDTGFSTCASLLELAPTSEDIQRVIDGMEQEMQGLKQETMPPALRGPLAKLWEEGRPPTSLVLFSMRMGSDLAYQEALARIADSDVAVEDRVALIEALGQTGHAAAIQPLLNLLRHADDVDTVRSVSLSALARFDEANIVPAVLTSYDRFTAKLQREARHVIYSRPAWTRQLLEAIDRDEFDLTQIRHRELAQLSQHRDNDEIRRLVDKHWGDFRVNTPIDKRQRMAEIARTLGDGPGDTIRGKESFQATCGKCHQLHGVGNRIGPDLTPYPRHELAYLLLHIVDPSAVVRPAYQSFVVSTVDGRVLTGLLAESTPKTVTLLTGENKRLLLARREIEAMKESPLSLMPDNLFAELPAEQVRDLFAYLQSQTDQPVDRDLGSLIDVADEKRSSN